MNILLNRISFSYNPETPVFDNHTIFLASPDDQKNKLFAVIGPSNTGKTTLISIIGGQLKPDAGEVIVDGVNIYNTFENKRRTIVAAQLQKDIPIHGSVWYHMKFGLPLDYQLQESDAKEVLRKVGLWHFFYERDGLETNLGIDGIRLSLEQKQRLHLGCLYLRAMHYKPSVVLIDEPIYTMNDMSEKVITSMIREISEHSTTIVVARRINTLQSVSGILDTSLLATKKSLMFLNHKDLLKSSKYYNYLQNGSVTL